MGEHPNDDVTTKGQKGEAVSSQLLPGELLADRFLVVRHVASGGMGDVYEVEDRQLHDVRLALKTILPHVAGNSEMRLRFEREVLLARRVNHPNLCPIYDLRTTVHRGSDLMFLTMKLFEGETLAARLKRSGPMTLADATPIVEQVGAALTAAHDAGVLHRDIKTANIMLQGEGQSVHAVVMDFGLARAVVAEDSATTLTVDGVVGTLGYLAPELLRGAPASKASDVFAFGVVVYKMLTGQVPSAALDLKAKLARDPALAKLPPEWQQLVLGCLETSPQKRFQDMPEAQASLQGVRRKVRSGPGMLSRRKMLALAGGAAAGVGVGAWFEWPQVENWMHPLPAKRFVAVMDWPPPSDEKTAPLITAVIDAIGSELARAEAFDSNLYIIPKHLASNITSLSQVDDVRMSLGANLVLAASAVPGVNEMQLLLRVLDTAKSATLRQELVKASGDDHFSLPSQSVGAAAKLLNIAVRKRQGDASEAGTANKDALAAFQAAEELRARENDTGLVTSIDKYKEAVQLDPNFANAQAQLGWAYYRLYILHGDPGVLTLAKQNAEAALQHDPHLVSAYVALASAIAWRGDLPGALSLLAKAMSIDPRNPNTILVQGQMFTRCNRWDDAEQAFASLQRARPNYWLGYEEQGVAYASDAKYSKAITALQAAAAAAPRRTVPLLNLTSSYLALGKIDDALDTAKKCWELFQDDDGASAMTSALRGKGKYGDSLAYALKATSLNPDWPANWLDLADSFLFSGEKQTEAKAAFERLSKMQVHALETNPGDGQGRMMLALAQAKLGEAAKSAESLKEADKHYSKDIDSQLSKIRILELLGQRTLALELTSECMTRGARPFQLTLMPDMDSLRKDENYKAIASRFSV